jgi:hypothetical protein
MYLNSNLIEETHKPFISEVPQITSCYWRNSCKRKVEGVGKTGIHSFLNVECLLSPPTNKSWKGHLKEKKKSKGSCVFTGIWC